MDKKTIFIAFGNQKGGVGKSALTTIYASYLHYELMKNVIVIDCDYPQHSIVNMRESDIETMGRNSQLQALLEKRFDLTGRKAYKIIKASPETALETVINQLDKNKVPVDVVLFDLPGTVNSQGVLNVIINLDFIFIPIIADRRALNSSLSFAMTLNKNIQDTTLACSLKGAYFFWNKVDKRENTELYEIFTELAKDMKLPILKTQIPDTKKYNKELSVTRTDIFRSTLFPPDKRLLRNSNLEKLVTEINKMIGL
ncbi:ParA family protein [Prevotella sp. 10(H)]|uniref:ParA family protein n=1 Tax=Prevotella sp. 10(H) TaxID=1158294 RepID=UPI0004A6E86D|nr:ParA family protein [Prevotella sp. 10(H)]